MAGRGTLDEVLARSDIVSLHVPLTADTRHMIDEGRLARMKRDAILVNAARGGVVDEIALAAALRAGRLGGAALDVFETEPVTAASGAIFAGIANLILTPHIAGVTVESNERVSGMIADAVLERLRKAP
jgi:(S)-sulfolactate dehydrogenase